MNPELRRLGAALAIALVSVVAGQGAAQEGAAPPSPAPTPPPVSGARLGPGQPIPGAELEAFVDGAAAQAMVHDHIAGLAISVVQDGQTVLQKGYGLDRLSPARPVDPDRTLFRLGGVTGAFTWIALMREIEAGHVRLDAPINVYLPQKDQVPDEGKKSPITVRDLIGHQAGFEERAYGQLIEKDADRIRPLEVYLRQERPRRVREPGGAPSFSYYGVALAGEALAQVTGKIPQSLADLEVSGPLGLRRTTLREPYPRRADLTAAPMSQALAADVSQGVHWTGTGFLAEPFEFMTQVAPAASGSSTPADMGRFMLAMLGDGTLGSATIYSPAIAKDFRSRLPGSAAGQPGWDYGFSEYELPAGLKGYGLDGQTLSFRARLVTVPDLKLGVFVAANTDTAGPFVSDLASQIVRRFYARPAEPPPPSEWLKQNASAFTGDYLTTRRAYHGLESFVDLLEGGTRVSASDGVLVTSGPEGTRRWTPEPGAALDAPLTRFSSPDGQTLAFEMRDGRATRWFAPLGEAAYERSGPLSEPWLLALLAGATALASIATLAGVFLRDRREFRQTSIQGRADAAQISASILWLIAIGGILIWRAGDREASRLMYDWPTAWLLIASACAFVAAVMTAICLGLAPVAWRGGRRLDSWTGWRKARFTFTTLLFALFAVIVGLWGGLEPWSH
jgi:CubicO group peptidase (beta-lactamase class C family)